jgi:hypothetical protein
VGENGQPITILRNGQSQLDLDFNNWFPIYEDIQNDDSSIYLTSGQTIPILYGSFRRASFQLDGIPEANTTKLLQEVDIVDPDASPKELDDINNPIDSINQEPDLSTEELFREKYKEKFNEELDKISELNKSDEDARTRSNITSEEQNIRDEYRVGENDI